VEVEVEVEAPRFFFQRLATNIDDTRKGPVMRPPSERFDVRGESSRKKKK
jgi:hypothetical protein